MIMEHKLKSLWLFYVGIINMQVRLQGGGDYLTCYLFITVIQDIKDS